MSAIVKRPDAYEHIPPDSVGNGTRFVMSELAGKSTILLKAKELGIELDGPTINQVVDTLKHLEHEGYHFEVADASLELLMRRAAGLGARTGSASSPSGSSPTTRARTTTAGEAPDGVTTEATIKVQVGEERLIATAEGNGPVNALDRALRDALDGRYPALDRIHLTDYKVRVLDTAEGHRRDHPGAARHHRRRGDAGPRSASARTSSRPAGRPCRTRSSTACSEPRTGGSNQPCPPTRTCPSRSTREPRQEQNLAPGVHMPPSGPWRADRPGRPAARSSRRARCSARPARTSASRSRSPAGRATAFRLEPGEHVDDAVAVVAEIAMKRAATFGRAPTILDVDFAIELLGYLGDAPDDVRRWRPERRAGADHDYVVRRAIVDTVSTSLLRLSLAGAARAPRGGARGRSRAARVADAGRTPTTCTDADL